MRKFLSILLDFEPQKFGAIWYIPVHALLCPTHLHTLLGILHMYVRMYTYFGSCARKQYAGTYQPNIQALLHVHSHSS